MENKELEKTINELQDIMTEIGDINFLTQSRSNMTYYQKKINNVFEKIYALKKHLEFILHIEE